MILGLALPTPTHADYDHPNGPPRFTYPNTDRAWGPLELSTIEAILRIGPAEAYPRLAYAGTRNVFLKMVDEHQLARATDNGVPVLHRLINLRTFDGYIGCYRARYNIKARQGAPLQQELVRLQVFQLELSALAVQLTERFVASLDAEERERLRQTGFFSAFGTLRTHLDGIVISLSEQEIYSIEDRIALAEAIGRTFPGMRRIFSSKQSGLIAAELGRLAGRTDDTGLVRALETAAAVVATR